MAIPRTFPLYLHTANPVDPLLTDYSSLSRSNHMVITQGDKFTLRIYFVTTPGSSPVYDIPDVTDTIILAAKKAPADTTPAILISSWSREEDYIEATFDAGVASNFWANASQNSRLMTCDVEVRDATNNARITYQFPILIRRQVYGGESQPGAITPYLDMAAALGVFVSFTEEQELTNEQLARVAGNIGRTDTVANRVAARDSQGRLAAAASLLGSDSNNSLNLKGLDNGTIIVSVVGATDQYVFDSESFPPSDITAGMYLYGGFPAETTVISTDGGVITTSAGLLSSGTSQVFASTSSVDPRPRIVMTWDGTEVFTVSYNGDLTGLSGTFSNLVVNGGPFQVDAAGNMTNSGSITSNGPIYLFSGSQGFEHSVYYSQALNEEGNPTLGFFSQTGASTWTGDMWLGAWSGTGQGVLQSRTGIWGYDAGGSNTFGLDTETGTLFLGASSITSSGPNISIPGALLIGTGLSVQGTTTLSGFSITLGGNVSFGSTGRSLASSSSAAGAATVIGLGTGNSPVFTGGTASNSAVVQDGTITTANSGRRVLVDANGRIKAQTLVAETVSTVPAWMSLAGVSFTAPASGAGAGTGGNGWGGYVLAPTTAVGYQLFYSTNNSISGIFSNGQSPFVINFADLLGFSFRIILSNNAGGANSVVDPNSVFEIRFGGQSSDTTINLKRKGFGVKQNGLGTPLILTTYATGHLEVTSSFTPTHNVAFDLTVLSINGNVYMYVNGSLVASAVTGPTGVSVAYGGMIMLSVINTNVLTGYRLRADHTKGVIYLQ